MRGKSLIIMLVVWSGLLLILTLGYTKYVGGNAHTFWHALWLIFLANLLMLMVNILTAEAVWRFSEKKIVVNSIVEFFRKNNFPMRQYSTDRIGNYLSRLETDDAISDKLKTAVMEVNRAMDLPDSVGMLHNLRMFFAWERAYELYTPKTTATNGERP